MKLKTILVIILLAATLTGCSLVPNTNPETQEMVDEFFKNYESAGHKVAVTGFLSKNKWVTNDDANKVANEIDEIVKQVGKYYGSEKISENMYGKNTIQYVYLAKYERQPLRFIFRFYKPQDKWQVQSFNYVVDATKDLDK